MWILHAPQPPLRQPTGMPRHIAFSIASSTCTSAAHWNPSPVLSMVTRNPIGELARDSAEVATADRQYRAGDVRRFVRGEEQDRRHLLVDRAVTVHQARCSGLIDDPLVPKLFLASG